MGQGPQDNESAAEQAKDEQISDFIRGSESCIHFGDRMMLMVVQSTRVSLAPTSQSRTRKDFKFTSVEAYLVHTMVELLTKRCGPAAQHDMVHVGHSVE